MLFFYEQLVHGRRSIELKYFGTLAGCMQLLFRLETSLSNLFLFFTFNEIKTTSIKSWEISESKLTKFYSIDELNWCHHFQTFLHFFEMEFY